MKILFNIFAPIIIGMYSIAFSVNNSELFAKYTQHPYWCSTLTFVLGSCVVWLCLGFINAVDY